MPPGIEELAVVVAVVLVFHPAVALGAPGRLRCSPREPRTNRLQRTAGLRFRCIHTVKGPGSPSHRDLVYCGIGTGTGQGPKSPGMILQWNPNITVRSSAATSETLATSGVHSAILRFIERVSAAGFEPAYRLTALPCVNSLMRKTGHRERLGATQPSTELWPFKWTGFPAQTGRFTFCHALINHLPANQPNIIPRPSHAKA